jgi:hypothetical protein
VVELAAAFWRHAQTYYRKPDGTPTSEVKNFRYVLKPLNRLFGHTAATKFGPLALQSLREEMIRLGWTRKNINRQIGRVKLIFKWGASQELIPGSIYANLRTVAGLAPFQMPTRKRHSRSCHLPSRRWLSFSKLPQCGPAK